MCVYIVIACLDCPAKDPGTTETKHYDVNTELKTRAMLRKRDEAGNPSMGLFSDQIRASKKNRASLRSGMIPVGAELNNLHKGELGRWILHPYVLTKGTAWDAAPPFTPQYNGVVEVKNRYLIEVPIAVMTTPSTHHRSISGGFASGRQLHPEPALTHKSWLISL